MKAGRPRKPRTTPTEKFCPKCQQLRPARLFWHAAKSPDGLQSWCVRCASAVNTVYMRTKRARVEHVA